MLWSQGRPRRPHIALELGRPFRAVPRWARGARPPRGPLDKVVLFAKAVPEDNGQWQHFQSLGPVLHSLKGSSGGHNTASTTGAFVQVPGHSQDQELHLGLH